MGFSGYFRTLTLNKRYILKFVRSASHINFPLKMNCARSARINQLKQEMLSMYENAVSAVMPDHLIYQVLKQQSTNNFLINGKNYVFDSNVYIVGFGKAVLRMALEVHKILGNHLVKGILSVPEGTDKIAEADILRSVDIQVYGGAAGNFPDSNAETTALSIANLVQSLQRESILLVLISGGGSALLPAPVSGITVTDKAHLIYLLQSKGASIQEINSVRKKLSLLKGGRLAIMAHPATVISFILSDIIGDPLDLIASGPTVENCDSPSLPFEIIKKYKLENEIQPNVLEALVKTNAKHCINNIYGNVFNVLIGSNKTALETVKEVAKQKRYFPLILSDQICLSVDELSEWYQELCLLFCKSLKNNNIINQGELRNFLQNAVDKYNFNKEIVEDSLVSISQLISNNIKGLCVIGGGEPTVTIHKNCRNKGGRSQELALRFSNLMNRRADKVLSDFLCILMAAGTDGIDGPTDAAGAFGYLDQINVANSKKLNPQKFIDESNSYGYFSSLPEDMIKIGHTGTNVMDLHVIFIQKYS